MIPQSFISDGFAPAASVRNRKRLLIGTDGAPDTGKTEFALSCPGPGLGIILDRGLDGCLDNPNPPVTRKSKDWAIKVIATPLPTQSSDKRFYLDHWKKFYEWYRKALDNPDAVSILIDGDSDSWQLQRLAEFGQLTQIPPLQYTNVNEARRAMYTRAWDSGKIVVFTNKIKKEYETMRDGEGNVVMKDGREQREWTGEYERQGWPDQDYLFHIQLSHLYKPAQPANGKRKFEIPAQFGLRINKCKRNRDLVGTELWGESCCFAGLVHCVYPEVEDKEWGL